MDLLVVGDANPDLILRGGDLVPAFGQQERVVDEAALVLGGSGSIMACGAARLGLRVGMAACVGDDTFGEFTREALRSAGVDDAAVQVLPGVATGVSVALAREDDRAILTARGALAAFDPAGVPDSLLGGARHVHVASPFLQPLLLAGLAELIARAHAAGATVSVDPGWDPAERWLLAGEPDVLLPNVAEAVRLAGQPSSEAAGAALAAAGPLVALKLGAAGAVGFAGESVVRASAPVIDAVDSTGAGDSFDAGFLAAWLDGASLADALALGCACGALSTRTLGGTAAQPSRAEAEALAHKVAT
jgi:sugar/nucleoside kinase (ribokinase family)